jgi:hypothetical protein
MKQVRITWNDSLSGDGWTFKRDLDMKLAEIITVGFLVGETKDLICVAASACGVSQFNGTMCIPKLCIVKQEHLVEEIDEPDTESL